MSDQTEGPIADAYKAAQRGLKQAGEAKDQLTQFIQDHPVSVALLVLGVGYILGKIT